MKQIDHTQMKPYDIFTMRVQDDDENNPSGYIEQKMMFIGATDEGIWAMDYDDAAIKAYREHNFDPRKLTVEFFETETDEEFDGEEYVDELEEFMVFIYYRVRNCCYAYDTEMGFWVQLFITEQDEPKEPLPVLYVHEPVDVTAKVPLSTGINEPVIFLVSMGVMVILPLSKIHYINIREDKYLPIAVTMQNGTEFMGTEMSYPAISAAPTLSELFRVVNVERMRNEIRGKS